jgi:hypothetical protein
MSFVIAEEPCAIREKNSLNLVRSVNIGLNERHDRGYVGNWIGYGQFYINHSVAMTKEGRVCWPSIAVGDDNY